MKCDLTYKHFCEILFNDKTGRDIVVYDDTHRSTLHILANSSYLMQFCGNSDIKISLSDCDVVLSMSSQKTFSISQFVAKQKLEPSQINKFDFILGEQQQQQQLQQRQKFSNKPFKFK